MIELSRSTTILIEEIDTLSGNALTYKKELALLVEIAQQHKLIPALDEISFRGKFIHKAFRLLQRTGSQDKDSQRLAQEFQESIEKTKSMMKDFLSFAPAEVQEGFLQTFLNLTPEAFERLLVLCKDLSWYKNYQLDTRRT